MAIRLPLKDTALGQWLTVTGNQFHPSLVLMKNDPEAGSQSQSMGFCVHTDAPIPQNTRLVSCSIDIAITPRKSRDTIAKLLAACTVSDPGGQDMEVDGHIHSSDNLQLPELNTDAALSSWLDHQVMCLYLMLTKLSVQLKPALPPPETGVSVACFERLICDLFSSHVHYVSSLPSSEDLMTPLYWTAAEMEKLQSTNLYQATLDRQRDWVKEFEELMAKIKGYTEYLYGYFSSYLSRADYVWAATMLSSRAFPSTLLEPCVRRADLGSSKVYTENAFKFRSSTDLASFSEPVPVLLPGVDILNHQRGIKVEWRPRNPHDPESGTEIISLEERIPPGSQVFNNYGAKSTAELILGYGFALDQADWDRSAGFEASISNPDDLYTLKISPPPTTGIERNLVKRIFDSFDASELCHELAINGPFPDGLMAQLRLLVPSTQEELEIIEAAFSNVDIPGLPCHPSFYSRFLECMPPRIGWENERNVLDCLYAILDVQLERMISVDWTNDDAANWIGVRDPVRKMIVTYRTGQHDILLNSLDRLFDLILQTTKEAENDGYTFMTDEEDYDMSN